MKKISNKRAIQNKEYKKVCAEIRSDESKQFCIFCYKSVDKHSDIHHLKGRDGDLMTDKDNLFLAHRECHTHYHHSTVKVLFDLGWYDNFLVRLFTISEEAYNREVNRIDKSDIVYIR